MFQRRINLYDRQLLDAYSPSPGSTWNKRGQVIIDIVHTCSVPVKSAYVLVEWLVISSSTDFLDFTKDTRAEMSVVH